MIKKFMITPSRGVYFSQPHRHLQTHDDRGHGLRGAGGHFPMSGPEDVIDGSGTGVLDRDLKTAIRLKNNEKP
jgi:hypothetical protein